MTKAEQRHLSAVAELGCIACRRIGISDSPAEAHHIRSGVGMGQRSSHFEVIGLCPLHHRTGGYGVAIHAGQKTWEAKFGTELELLEWINVLLEMDI